MPHAPCPMPPSPPRAHTHDPPYPQSVLFSRSHGLPSPSLLFLFISPLSSITFLLPPPFPLLSFSSSSSLQVVQLKSLDLCPFTFLSISSTDSTLIHFAGRDTDAGPKQHNTNQKTKQPLAALRSEKFENKPRLILTQPLILRSLSQYRRRRHHHT